jgi:hypothetical protein
MSEQKSVLSKGGRSHLLTLAIVFVVLAPLVYSAVSWAVNQDDATDEIFLERPDPKYTACVKDTEYMRYHHWELLRSVREDVVRYGIRGDIGLKECGNCHVSRERFCDQCHNAVSLKPDCFECHYYE